MIEIEKVSKTYNPGTRKANTVLKEASLELPDKGFVFIIGKSGTGKSTILNAVGGLISYEGTILYDKQQVEIEKYRRKNIGYVFQDFLLFDELSVRDNIKIALNLNGVYDEEEITRRVNILLKAVGLNINSARRASALSLGQRQRVAIARALASSPKIILADEPTGNLDSKNSMVVMDILKELSKEKLVICVTHNINLVRMYADHAFAIVDQNFLEVNPQGLATSGGYGKQELDLSQMTEQDFADENLVIKAYVAKGGEKQEISIVSRNGKILVVGNNIAIASPDQIQLASASSQPEKEKIPENGEKAIKPLSQPLAFASRDEKRPLAESPFVQSVLNRVRGSRAKLTKGQGFMRFLETILPLIIFILLDFAIGTIAEIRSYGLTASHPDNQVILVPTAGNGKTSFSQEEVFSLLNDPDSGLTATPDDNRMGGSRNNYIIKVGTAHSSIFYTDFSVYQDVVQGSVSNGSFLMNFAPIEKYREIADMKDGLSQFDLKDDEIVIDRSLITSLLRAQTYQGPAEKAIIGSDLRISFEKYGLGESYHHYKIVGISDTANHVAYANAKTCQKFRLESYDGITTADLQMPDFKDYLIVNYADVKNSSDYTFTDSDTSGTTEKNFRDFLISSSGSIPGAYLSQTAKQTIYTSGYFQGPDSTLYQKILKYSPTMEVSYLPDPTKKVICFVDYTSKGYDIKSSSLFFDAYLASALRFNSSTETYQGTLSHGTLPAKWNEILVPDVYLKYFGNDLAELNKALAAGSFYFSNYIATEPVRPQVSGTYSSSSLGDPVYMSEETVYMLLGGQNYETVSYASTNGSYNPLAAAFSEGSFFVTADAQKTAAYFQARENDGTYNWHLKSYTYAEAYYENVTLSLFEMVKGFITAIVFVLGILTLILVLDSVSRINKEKYRFGVLRCLGMPSWQLIADDSMTIFGEAIFTCLLPTIVGLIILSIFYLNFLSWWYLIFLAGYALIVFIASEVPLIILLRKKPIDILKNLS